MVWGMFGKFVLKQAAKLGSRRASATLIKQGRRDAMRKGATAAQRKAGRAAAAEAKAAGVGKGPLARTAGFAKDTAYMVAADNAANLAMNHLGFSDLAKNIPAFFHSITVEVTGGPGADLRRCWYLALAACFGRYRRGLKGISGRTMAAQWDITGKTVSVTMSYTFSGLADNAFNLLTDNLSRSGIEMFHEGPDQVTIGAGWPTFFYTSRQALSTNYKGIRTGIGPALGSLITGTTGLTRWPDWMLLDDGQGAQTYLPSGPGEPGVNLKANYDLPPEYNTTPGDSSTPQGANWVATYSGFFAPSASYAEVINARFDTATYEPDIFRELPYGTHTVKGFTFAVMTNSPAAYHQFDVVDTGGKKAPRLDDDGRVITTGEKFDPLVQNPRPPVDGLLKGSVLAMVSQALQTPGYLVGTPPPVGGRAPLGYKGRFVYPSGSAPANVTLALDRLLERPMNLATPVPTPGYSGRVVDPTNIPDSVVSTGSIR